MTYMKQLERLLFLINALKAKPCTTHELFAQLSEQNSNSSIRQLQRDFKDIALLLSNNEINNLNRRIRNQQVKFKLGNNSINKILLISFLQS